LNYNQSVTIFRYNHIVYLNLLCFLPNDRSIFIAPLHANRLFRKPKHIGLMLLDEGLLDGMELKYEVHMMQILNHGYPSQI
ncbi:hypothetical protein ACJX0J_040496, partial [Zea mays]